MRFCQPLGASCHLCWAPNSNEIMKCKLCCDGLEQNVCRECAALCAAYKKTLSDADFQKIIARRREGFLTHGVPVPK